MKLLHKERAFVGLALDTENRVRKTCGVDLDTAWNTNKMLLITLKSGSVV